ncbi:DUF982 domain-containing protein [Aminobacter sp. HY435]|uniref:DUF982 domain-containing protein n=1 Tax=Aminobacter sp. HY435 TaxID=2970917 RepID=UPI0022B97C7F|nr:DUF982 domain-containing protein [Aminobacter sp. HY435]
MDRMLFDNPVSVRIGSESTQREVTTVKGAYEALVDWPHAKRSGPLYREAVEIVSAALAGTRTREAARRAFVAAAEEIGVLVS